MKLAFHQPGQVVRRGVAAVEMALLAPVLLIFLAGIWEVGRLIMIQNMLDSAARSAARLGASGGYFSSSNFNSTSGGTISLVSPSTNTAYELQLQVQAYMQGAGLTTTGMTVTVANVGTATTARTWSYTWNQAGGSTGTGYDPTAAATMLDQINVTVTLPYKNVAWSPMGYFLGSSTTLTATATWVSMTDVPLTVSTTIPTQPLQPSDTLP